MVSRTKEIKKIKVVRHDDDIKNFEYVFRLPHNLCVLVGENVSVKFNAKLIAFDLVDIADESKKTSALQITVTKTVSDNATEEEKKPEHFMKFSFSYDKTKPMKDTVLKAFAATDKKIKEEFLKRLDGKPRVKERTPRNLLRS